MSGILFSQQLSRLDTDDLWLRLGGHSEQEVEYWLSNPEKIPGNTGALSVLLSPAARNYIEPLAQLSCAVTRQRFGNNIGLFAPLYVSNLCSNDCDYCGFSMKNSIKRKVLSSSELNDEANILKQRGIESLLLVSGEHEQKVGVEYFAKVLSQLRDEFSYLAIEVQPLPTEEYRQLVECGLNAVMVYQETYCPRVYAKHHIRGRKRDFEWRLNCPDRTASAGVDKIGLGVLLGLSEWRRDALLLGHHLAYLENRYWRSRYSISMPRLRPCTGNTVIANEISDLDFVQMLCAFRLFSPETEISLSTRESVSFRDNLLKLGITHMSSDSSTEPGGYSNPNSQLDQFQVSDERSTAEVAHAIRLAGLQPVWKDWQSQW